MTLRNEHAARFAQSKVIYPRLVVKVRCLIKLWRYVRRICTTGAKVGLGMLHLYGPMSVVYWSVCVCGLKPPTAT
jgi:hypothetical protein